MMLLCFALINAVIWIRARRKGSVSQPSRSVHPVVLYLLFALMFFSIVTFSWWWSTAVVGGDTVSASLASRGLNDTSNAIRFNSNLYAIEQISKDPLLIFRGYETLLAIKTLCSRVLRCMGTGLCSRTTRSSTCFLSTGFSIQFFTLLCSALSSPLMPEKRRLAFGFRFFLSAW